MYDFLCSMYVYDFYLTGPREGRKPEEVCHEGDGDAGELVIHDLRLVEVIKLNNKSPLGVSPGLVVMEGDSCSQGHGFESAYWMDIFSHLFAV